MSETTVLVLHMDGTQEVKTVPIDPDAQTVKPNAERREDAYNTEQVVEWEGAALTITEAAQKWQYYAAEGSEKAAELQTLIAAAKEKIREKYPEVVTGDE